MIRIKTTNRSQHLSSDQNFQREHTHTHIYAHLHLLRHNKNVNLFHDDYVHTIEFVEHQYFVQYEHVRWHIIICRGICHLEHLLAKKTTRSIFSKKVLITKSTHEPRMSIRGEYQKLRQPIVKEGLMRRSVFLEKREGIVIQFPS